MNQVIVSEGDRMVYALQIKTPLGTIANDGCNWELIEEYSAFRSSFNITVFRFSNFCESYELVDPKITVNTNTKTIIFEVTEPETRS